MNITGPEQYQRSEHRPVQLYTKRDTILSGKHVKKKVIKTMVNKNE